MVLTVPTYVSAGTTASSASNLSQWEYRKVENLTDDTVRGVDLSLYQANVGWKKQFTNYKQ